MSGRPSSPRRSQRSSGHRSPGGGVLGVRSPTVVRPFHPRPPEDGHLSQPHPISNYKHLLLAAIVVQGVLLAMCKKILLGGTFAFPIALAATHTFASFLAFGIERMLVAARSQEPLLILAVLLNGTGGSLIAYVSNLCLTENPLSTHRIFELLQTPAKIALRQRLPSFIGSVLLGSEVLAVVASSSLAHITTLGWALGLLVAGTRPSLQTFVIKPLGFFLQDPLAPTLISSLLLGACAWLLELRHETEVIHRHTGPMFWVATYLAAIQAVARTWAIKASSLREYTLAHHTEALTTVIVATFLPGNDLGVGHVALAIVAVVCGATFSYIIYTPSLDEAARDWKPRWEDARDWIAEHVGPFFGAEDRKEVFMA